MLFHCAFGMLFNSIHFLVFMPVVTVLYFALRDQRRRRLLLLAASLYFYATWSAPFLLLMAWQSFFDYYASLIIGRSTHERTRRTVLIVGLTVNTLTLCVFKYHQFVNTSLGALFGQPHLWTPLNIVLPMAISFYTFEAMSYLVDVYHRKLPPCKSVLDYALYITFFPHLVAGPIMRATDLLPQFQEKHEPNAERILSGVLLCVWGLIKKTYIADPMGVIANAVYGHGGMGDVATTSGAGLLLATYAFAVQIYCDFSAYSDVARGAGRILGYRIMVNFDSPYLAVTVRDFWRRWHISLSTWLRDYLYVPLGGSRVSEARTYVNLAITMLIGGLWHGASWTFVVWGGLQGLYLIVERATGTDRLDPRKMSTVERLARGVVTFHLTCLAWIFFRANSEAQALQVVWRILTWASGDAVSLAPALWVLAIVGGQIVKSRVKFGELFLDRPALARWGVYASVALLVLVYAGSPSPEFIYFQF